MSYFLAWLGTAFSLVVIGGFFYGRPFVDVAEMCYFAGVSLLVHFLVTKLGVLK